MPLDDERPSISQRHHRATNRRASSSSSRSRKQKKRAASTLPDKPTAAEIEAGIEKVLPQAKACGPRHGVQAGTSVSVKMSIAGATGEVTGATARRPHQETALGRCVAAALSNAKLERFRKPSIGVVYPVRM